MKSQALKIMLSAIMFLSFVSFTACDQPRLFDAKETTQPANQSPLRGSNGDPVINLGITGGFAGVNKLLVIDSNGFVSFTDFSAGGEGYTDYLSAAEYAELLAKFAAADFFHLDDGYMTPNAADLFWYDLTFTQNGVSKRVMTDHLTAPESLQAIVEALERIIQKLVENNLQLTLAANQESFKIGETVKLTFTVKNLSDAPLTLYFNDGQVFDFYVVTPEIAGPRYGTGAWNWANGKSFTQALQTLIFAGAQTASYEIEWDGRDNNGRQLVGNVLVAAKLVSVPGGNTRLLPLYIQN
jgi:hypothetical protein